jgi:hypothetical protein
LKKVKVMLSCIISVVFLVSCAIPVVIPELPIYITQLKSKNTVTNPADTNVGLYFDNSTSMSGFVQSSTQSNFVLATDGLYDIIKGYTMKSGFYKLGVPQGKKYSEWLEISDSKLFQSGYKTQDFYNSSGEFQGGMGPLQLLFNKNSIVNFDNINIFITDLAEQNLQNTELARSINNIVQSRENYSVSIFVINSYFSGTASVPIPGTIDPNGNLQFVNIKGSGQRPYYCIIVGPTSGVKDLTNSFKDLLADKNIKENTGYFSTIILAYNGMQKTPFDEIIKTNSLKFEKGITPVNSNETINLFPNKTEDIFSNVNEEYPCFTFSFDTKYQSENKKTACLNLIIPIKDLTNGSMPSNVEYKIDTGKITFYSTSKVKKKVNLSSTTNNNSNNNSSKLIQTKESNTYEWDSLTKFQFDKLMTTKLTFLKKGDIISKVSSSNDALLKSKTTYTVKNDNGVLNVRLDLSNMDSITSSYISIYIPIEASRKSDEIIPNWVRDLNLNTSTPTLEKTANLLEFYKVLTGSFGSQAEKDAYQAKEKITIADIAINIKMK